MEPILYNLIEFGIDPCILKLVCSSWRYTITEIDRQIKERVQWRMPEQSLEFIIMMLIDAFDDTMLEITIMHMSIPIIKWDLISYLIENERIALLLFKRVKNRHTREMIRRLGIAVPIPKKEIFKISSVIGGQTSTAGVKSLVSIISSGYVDALSILLNKANNSISHEQLYTLINASLGMIVLNEEPFNCACIKWLFNNKQYQECIPNELFYMMEGGIDDKYVREHNMARISLDALHKKSKIVPVSVFHQLGKNILPVIASSSLMCENYMKTYALKSNMYVNIRVIDAIIRYCKNQRIRNSAIEIVNINGWNAYLAITNDC